MSLTEAIVLGRARHLELVACEVARQAAKYVRVHHGELGAAATKSSPTDVVTEADFGSEQLIREQLALRCPGSSVIGEEYDDTVGDNRISWVVDPIDGTVNFMYGLPVVSVSIAARYQGRTVAGAVTDVLSTRTYSAALGHGARCDGEAIEVSRPASLATSLVGTGFAYDAAVRAEQAQLLAELLPMCRDIRCMGSAALNMCWVGAGLLDGYFERNTKVYDYAAGAIVASEAGAVVALPPNENDGLTIAVSPSIAEELSSIIAV